MSLLATIALLQLAGFASLIASVWPSRSERAGHWQLRAGAWALVASLVLSIVGALL